MKIVLKFILAVIIISSVVVITPPFLNFMETQNDILCIKPKEQIQIQENPLENTQEENSYIEEMPIQEEKPIEETQTIETPVPSPNPIVQQAPIQEPAKETISNRNSELREEWIQFTATGYCACQKCCGKTNGVTASGAKAVAGITVAMPSSYSFGKKIQLKSANGNLMNGGNYYTVQDRGGAIKSNRIDIFFSSHQEALNFGRRTVYLKVVN